MDNQISKLTKILRLWFDKNGLDGDLTIYPIEKWLSRKEKYLNDAELIITTEGAFNFLINYGGDDDLLEEFDELLQSFGYYYEMGYNWCLGLYKIDEIQMQNIKSNYQEKLKDERWTKKRDFIRQRAKYKCEDCGSADKSLEIHHCYYLYGFEPWEYPTGSLRCLCKSCHKSRDLIEKKFRGRLANYTQEEIKTIDHFLENVTCWYPKSDVFEFIRKILGDQNEAKKALDNLLSKRRNNNQ